MTGKQGLGLEDDEAGNGADAACSDADAPPGGYTEAGTDANGPAPANVAASARQSGVKRGGNSGQTAGEKDTGHDGTAGDSGGIAQLRHLVSELIKGAEKKTASKLARLEKQGKTLAESVEANAVMLRQLVERRPGAGAGSEGAAEGAAKLLERIGPMRRILGDGWSWNGAGAGGGRRWPSPPGFRPSSSSACSRNSSSRSFRSKTPQAAGAAMSGNSTDESSLIARSRR